jgi:hypothetical protein
MFDLADGWILATTNATIRKDGALVMGRGAALEAKSRYEDLDYRLGHIIADSCGSGGLYGVLFADVRYPEPRLGAFQVKYNWNEQADLDLINYSMSKLITIATAMPHERFNLNFPGIRNGRLGRREVLDALDPGPDNIIIWEYEFT